MNHSFIVEPYHYSYPDLYFEERRKSPKVKNGSAVSGVILSGGRCSRHGGKNKAMIDIGGKRIIDRIYDVMKSVFRDLILVTNEPSAYDTLDVRIVQDIYKERSALTGLHAGLDAARNTHAFVVACDAPHIRKELIELLLSHYHSVYDVLIPETMAGVEPLFAVYSKRCLPFIEHHLEQKKYKIKEIYPYLNVAKMDESILRECDKNLASFFNVNTPELIDTARDMME